MIDWACVLAHLILFSPLLFIWIIVKISIRKTNKKFIKKLNKERGKAEKEISMFQTGDSHGA